MFDTVKSSLVRSERDHRRIGQSGWWPASRARGVYPPGVLPFVSERIAKIVTSHVIHGNTYEKVPAYSEKDLMVWTFWDVTSR